MADVSFPHDESLIRLVPKSSPKVLLVLGIGVLIFCGSLSLLGLVASPEFWHAWLLNWIFLSSISVGALFFLSINYVVGATWSDELRRIAEVLASSIWPLAVLFLPILAVVWAHDGLLYKWNRAEAILDPLVAKKAAWLNPVGFALRSVLYLGIWSWLARYYLTWSLEHQAGNPGAERRLKRMGVIGILLLAVSVNFAAVDWLMSLDPHWYSTIFGIYYFAGCATASSAMMILIVSCLQRRGEFLQLKEDQIHDLGKWLFMFVCFWAYIAFSQYLLIWYANIPEETQWYLVRQSEAWSWMALLLIVGHFALPFAALLSRRAKRSPSSLVVWSVFLLVMHWIDLYWLIMPTFSPKFLPFNALIPLTLLGFGGCAFGSVLLVSGKYPARAAKLSRKHSLLNTGNSIGTTS